jgi:hypothetical protein
MADKSKIVHNIDLVVKKIKKFPQTYDTILQDEKRNGTLQFILRRKLNSLCKQGEVCKTSIPGTRFGKALFFSLPKEYYILVEADRTSGSKVYAFFKYRKLDRYRMIVEICWELKKDRWKKLSEDKVFFEGSTLKFL